MPEDDPDTGDVDPELHQPHDDQESGSVDKPTDRDTGVDQSTQQDLPGDQENTVINLDNLLHFFNEDEASQVLSYLQTSLN